LFEHEQDRSFHFGHLACMLGAPAMPANKNLIQKRDV
jgi:hypothetical protein